MKNALILFLDKDKPLGSNYIGDISKLFFESGFNLSAIEMLSKTDDLGLKRAIEKFKGIADNLVIVDDLELDFSVKEVICSALDKRLVENENARSFASAVSVKIGETPNPDYFLLPQESTLIPNVSGAVQGFMLDEEEFTLAYLPKEFSELSLMAKKYLFPYIEQKHGLDYKRYTFKYFGDKSLLEDALDKAKTDFSCDFSWNIDYNFGDIKLEITFDNKRHQNKEEVIRFIVSTFNDEIYATYDVSLSERLFDALKLKKLKLSTAESFTAGNIVSSIIKYSGASDIVDEGIVCYSNDSKKDRLKVKSDSLERNGAVSSVVAYEMALGLLTNGRCDLAIATTGIAGPNSDNTSKPVGLCYIAIGMKDGIHTYKYNFKGSREEVTKLATNTATYLAIKKIKKL